MGLLYESLYRISLSVGARLNSKIAQGLGERTGWRDRLTKAAAGWKTPPLWMHVASAGEFEQAIPILEALKKKGDRPLLLTYFSPSAASAVRRESNRRSSVPWDWADYSPLDTAEEVSDFLDLARPAAFVAVHRELWPGLVEGCQKRGIPRVLVAAQLTQGLPWIQRRLIRDFTLVATTDAESLKAAHQWVSPERCENLGDPRVARVYQRSTESALPWTESLKDRPNLVAASLWPSDFVAAEPFFRQALELGWRVILVPHELEPKFLRRLEQWLEQRDAPHQRWSQVTFPTTHLVVDEVGLLTEFYRVADLVFVGGSFEKRVHNVLEPAVHGCPILTGPKMQNSLEAREMQGGGLLSAGSPEELALLGRRLLTQNEERLRQGELARAYLTPRLNSAERIAQRLGQILDTKKG